VEPVRPSYDGAGLTNLVPALLGARPSEWLPAVVRDARAVVLLVVDGLGWEAVQNRPTQLLELSSLEGQPITTVVPSTTATALTSITTGLPPSQHGIVGYRVRLDRTVLNVLAWQASNGRRPPEPFDVQRHPPFLGRSVPVVTKAEFASTGFTEAHLRGGRFLGWRAVSSLVERCRRLIADGEPFVYAYYDGVDKVAHEYGIGEHYQAELIAIDWMIEYLVEVLPRGAVLVITADHGQVDVGDRVIRPHPEVLSLVDFQSGEARFRWLHAVDGGAGELLDAAARHHGDVAWVMSRDQILDGGWFGPKVVDRARERLGDVALVARDDVAFDDPADTGPYDLVGRHGSMTSAEVLVPLLAARR